MPATLVGVTVAAVPSKVMKTVSVGVSPVSSGFAKVMLSTSLTSKVASPMVMESFPKKMLRASKRV